MEREKASVWYAKHDPYLQDPMRALLVGYTLEEVREEYSRVFVEKYAEEFFNRDVRRMAIRAYTGG